MVLASPACHTCHLASLPLLASFSGAFHFLSFLPSRGRSLPRAPRTLPARSTTTRHAHTHTFAAAPRGQPHHPHFHPFCLLLCTGCFNPIHTTHLVCPHALPHPAHPSHIHTVAHPATFPFPLPLVFSISSLLLSSPSIGNKQMHGSRDCRLIVVGDSFTYSGT